jgi:hypothetical protein
LYTSANGIGKLVFGVGSDNPLQAHLEAALGQQEVSLGEEKKSAEVRLGEWDGWGIVLNYLNS